MHILHNMLSYNVLLCCMRIVNYIIVYYSIVEERDDRGRSSGVPESRRSPGPKGEEGWRGAGQMPPAAAVPAFAQ